MLGKLIKHEFKETYKVFTILYAAFILLTLVSKYSLKLPFDNIISQLIGFVFNAVYFISMLGLVAVVTILIVIRFYNKMTKDESYLTHTIPVKMWQHIVAKITTYSVWMIMGIVMLLVSIVIYFAGDEEFEYIIELLDKGVELIGQYPSVIVSLILVLILGVLQTVSKLLVYSASISLGQLFPKYRILGAVLFYFVINTAISVFSNLIMYIVPSFLENLEGYETIWKNAGSMNDVVNSTCGVVNMMLIFAIVVAAVMCGICFFVTNYMLSKKLELE